MRPLRFSRYCRKFVDLELADYENDRAGLAKRVNELCARYRIDLVMPGDFDGQAALVAIKGELSTPVFPMPSQAQFEELNDKWRFQQLCQRLGLPIPKAVHLPDKSAIDADALEAELGYPMVIKPTGLGQSEGLVIAADRAALTREVLDNPDYDHGPMVAQSRVDGRDIGLDIFAVDGEVLCNSAHDRDGSKVIYLANDTFLEAARRIARELKLTGVYDFDALVNDQDGTLHLLECNARFWGTIAHAQWCGRNFVKTGIAVAFGQPVPEQPDIAGCTVRSPAHLLVRILTFRQAPRRLNRAERAALRQGLGDPVAMLLRAQD
ncbi:ATP-grasp domain-containing protein [Sinisalibacter aestuarii]|uniref:ATP-grasp domain-containing protein n=1 Tax=Sinisalibacter aestuarii TaxID=2949426 RepID=A0ABQ5LMX0_9RHOB|nr:ATP-grasp domain-containing protein [Sinisalibacter aestuarii]GKY86310.1 hypothetical protein STA1M1_01790 [Sinisalibacter aestuarii]